MLDYKPQLAQPPQLPKQPPSYQPSVEELPHSDDTPVDNELQDLIPGLLKALLALIWALRWDWFFGIDMALYYDKNKPPLVPDGFLSLGVPRYVDEKLRLSYSIETENSIPILVLEVVSQTYRQEYNKKKKDYAQIGVLYYVVYNPYRRRKPKLEVYRLVNGTYILQPQTHPTWMPEIGLGIGRERGTYLGITREWLYWYDEQGNRFLTAEERAVVAEQERQVAEQERQVAEQELQVAEQERQVAEQERQVAEERAQILAEQLRSLGVDPETLF